MNLRVRYFCAIAALAAPMAFAGAADAEVIMGWDVHTTSSTSSPLAATNSAAAVVSPVGLTLGTGISPTTSLLKSWGGASKTATSTTPTTAATAIDNNEFISFGFTVADGYSVSLSSIDLSYHRRTNGPNSGIWQYAVNNDTFNDIAPAVSFASTSTGGAALSPFTLTGISDLQDMAAGTNVTFRLVLFGAKSTSLTLGYWSVYDVTNTTADDLSLNGTVTAPFDERGSASPEPTTVALLALGTLTLFQRRRRA
ncbi:MAG: PEP-CTERM sorting domain-containing protein [Phycisphaerales bacterium]